MRLEQATVLAPALPIALTGAAVFEAVHDIRCRLDELLRARGMTLTEICRVLECEVGELLVTR